MFREIGELEVAVGEASVGANISHKPISEEILIRASPFSHKYVS